MAVGPALTKLAAAWEALPADVRGRAASALGVACAVMAEAIGILGAHGQTLVSPAVSVVMQAFQEVAIWGRPFEAVAAQIEAQFPAAVTLLKALAPDETPPPAAPPALPDAAP